MKRQLMTIALACAGAGLFATGLEAQEYRITANVPFAFIVGEKNCPAGAYAVEAQSFQSYEHLKNMNGNCSLFITGRRFLSEPAGRPRLVFHRYGQTYFLSKVWDGKGDGSSLPVTKREKHLQEATPPSELATLVVDGTIGQ